MAAQSDFRLPVLHPYLKLYQGDAATGTGEPTRTLHDPIANTYYRLNWAEFECLARFVFCSTAYELKQKVESETLLKIDMDDIAELVSFLQRNGLVVLKDQRIVPEQCGSGFLKKVVHSYLFFTVPLFRSQAFLDKTYPHVAWVLGQKFFTCMMGLLALGVILMLPRADEFFHTFTGLATFEGVIQILLILGFVKIVHELGHAYTATKYKIPVPHMGIAFIVMYPVLYTETTGAWSLSSRHDRLAIGMAGIRAELCLAAVFLMLWNIATPGSTLQTLSFMVVCVALVSSLLVNLNPLMRFDGYYMLSDMTGLENLQARACNFARWHIRRVLFSLPDDAPEFLNVRTQNFLVIFGYLLLIYRFFLFTGIALLVYHVFFKPLGLILFLIEIAYFIALPVLSEICIWWSRRQDIWQRPRGRRVILAVAAISLCFILPLNRTVAIPGILHAAEYQSVYPSTPSEIVEILVKEGDKVQAGDVILVLQSPKLEQDYKLAGQKLKKLESQLQQILAGAQGQDSASIQDQIHAAREKLTELGRKRDELIVQAPFAGMVRDMMLNLHAGDMVREGDLLARIVNTQASRVTAYGLDEDIERIVVGNSAKFIPHAAPLTSIPLKVETIDPANIEILPWAQLGSPFGGPIKSEIDPAQGHALKPIQAITRISLLPENKTESLDNTVLSGTIRITGSYTSPLYEFFRDAAGLFFRELGLN